MTPPVETSALLSGLPGARHGFFGRRGGVSTGAFASLNCSATVGDDPDAVASNRGTALAAVGATRLALCRQVHGAGIAAVAGPFAEDARPEADAMVTDTPGLALGILTADCVPVLLADPQAGVIGACHAGWRGAVAGVVENIVSAMRAAGADPSRIRAAIGPAISQSNYEVGPDWATALLARDPAHARYLATPAGGRAHFDLPGFVLDRLRDAGVGEPGQTGGCTFADPARYFSHRYATGRAASAGRQIALIVLA